MIETFPGALIDFELYSSIKVRVDFGDEKHPLLQNFVAAVEVIDRNDCPEFWTHSQATGLTTFMPLLNGAPSSGTYNKWTATGDHPWSGKFDEASANDLTFTYQFLSPNANRRSYVNVQIANFYDIEQTFEILVWD